MKTAVVFLSAVSLGLAAPFGFFPQNRQSSATGSASGNVVSGTSNGFGQSSQITQVSANAQGSVRGSGRSNNVASASNVGLSGSFGNNFQSSNTNAVSNQQTFDNRFNQQRPINHFNQHRPFNQFSQQRPINQFNQFGGRPHQSSFGFRG